MLFDPTYDVKRVTIIPIVGFEVRSKEMPLAQFVFNDERVQKHFDHTKWAYVPEINNHTVVMEKKKN